MSKLRRMRAHEVLGRKQGQERRDRLQRKRALEEGTRTGLWMRSTRQSEINGADGKEIFVENMKETGGAGGGQEADTKGAH